MATNLRVGFHEMQYKCLSKSITIDPSFSKKTCSTPNPNSLSKSTSSTPPAVVTLGPNKEPSSVGDIPYHGMKKPFVFTGSISEESFECSNPSLPGPKLVYVSNREEMSKSLSRIPSFTERDPLVHNIGVLFSFMQWILVEVNEYPNRSFMAQLPHDTLDTTISHIMYMKDYTAFEIAKVVGCPLLFPLMNFLVFPLIYCFIMIFVVPRWYPEFVTSCNSKRTSSND